MCWIDKCLFWKNWKKLFNSCIMLFDVVKYEMMLCKFKLCEEKICFMFEKNKIKFYDFWYIYMKLILIYGGMGYGIFLCWVILWIDKKIIKWSVMI